MRTSNCHWTWKAGCFPNIWKLFWTKIAIFNSEWDFCTAYAAMLKQMRQIGSLAGNVGGTTQISNPMAQGHLRLYEDIIGSVLINTTWLGICKVPNTGHDPRRYTESAMYLMWACLPVFVKKHGLITDLSASFVWWWPRIWMYFSPSWGSNEMNMLCLFKHKTKKPKFWSKVILQEHASRRKGRLDKIWSWG